MRQQTLITVCVGLLLVSIAVIAWVNGRAKLEAFLYPQPPAMPTAVDTPIEQLLAQLEAVLREKHPAAAEALRPGLTDAQVLELETRGGFELTEELRALYRWHDGMSAEQGIALFDYFEFPSLELVVERHLALRGQMEAETGASGAVSSLFAGHTESWVSIFPDLAGDGYFFDHQRGAEPGAFFYHFIEIGYYRFFPSLNSFLAGLIECYETDAYPLSPSRDDLDREQAIWDKYSTAHPSS